MAVESGVHLTALKGYTKGSFYEKNRPSYTDELVHHVIRSLYTGAEQDSQYDILELGAGTGKFTRKILTNLKQNVRYLATEPSEGFLETFRQLSPNIEAKQCEATNIPLANETVKNIICAQCFHWFANENSLNEMTRVLVPGGRIFLLWIHKDSSVPWVKELEDILTVFFNDDPPRAVKRQWKRILESYNFLTVVEDKILPGIQNIKGSKDNVVDHYSSISVIASLQEQEKKSAQASFRTVLDKFFKDGEEIIVPYYSEFCYAEKLIL